MYDFLKETRFLKCVFDVSNPVEVWSKRFEFSCTRKSYDGEEFASFLRIMK